MIKNIITTLLILFCLPGFSQSFQSELFYPDSVGSYIIVIDQQKKLTDDSLAFWTTEEIRFGCQYSWGFVTVYTSGGKLRLLLLDYSGEYGEVITSYYFESGKLYYVFVKEDFGTPDWDQETGQKNDELRHEEKYVYLYQEKTFDCSSREMTYHENSEMPDFYSLDCIDFDCDDGYFVQDVAKLFPCYPFKDYNPCLCNY
jgi:hypothetical protein